MPLDWHQRKPRKRISPTDRVSLKLSDRERALIIENTFAPDYLTRRLRLAVVGEKHPRWHSRSMSGKNFTATWLPEANHCDVRRLERELYRICDCIQEILDSHTDQD